MADNFIETDGGAHNLRVYNNRGINVWHSALSSQPVFGGPAYFIRNIVHTSGDSLKFSARPTGMIVYNNTFCTETSAASNTPTVNSETICSWGTSRTSRRCRR